MESYGVVKIICEISQNLLLRTKCKTKMYNVKPNYVSRKNQSGRFMGKRFFMYAYGLLKIVQISKDEI